MTLSQFAQVFALAALATLFATLFALTFGRRLLRRTARLLPPRYLKPVGIRRRQAVASPSGDAHEQR